MNRPGILENRNHQLNNTPATQAGLAKPLPETSGGFTTVIHDFFANMYARVGLSRACRMSSRELVDPFGGKHQRFCHELVFERRPLRLHERWHRERRSVEFALEHHVECREQHSAAR